MSSQAQGAQGAEGSQGPETTGSTSGTGGAGPAGAGHSGGPAGARELVSQALLPLAAVSAGLRAQAVDYVMDGEGGDVLDLLRQERARTQPCAHWFHHLLCAGGHRLGSNWDSSGIVTDRVRSGLSRSVRETLERVGVVWDHDVPSDSAEPVYRLRDALYRVPAAHGRGAGQDSGSAGPLSVSQWIRWGEVLHTAGALSVDREGRAGEPPWFVTLVDDVVATCPGPGWRRRTSAERMRRLRPLWTADFLAQILAAAGVPGSQVPGVLLETFLSGVTTRSGAFTALGVPGAGRYLAQHWDLALPSGVEALWEHRQPLLLELLHQETPVPAVLAEPLAGLAASARQEIRSAALRVLADVDAQAAVTALTTAVVSAPARVVEDLLDLLVRVDEDGAALAAVLERRPGLASLAGRLCEGRRLLAGGGEGTEEGLPGLPPFTPLPDTSAAPAVRELRRALDRLARKEGSEDPWERKQARCAQQLGEDALDELVDVAEGRCPGPSAVVVLLSLSWIVSRAPSLDLIHLTRLVHWDDLNELGAVLSQRATGSDVRVVEDALRRGAAPGVVDQVMEEVFLPWAWRKAEPQHAWPWMLQQGEEVVDRLASSSTATPVLRALQHAPSLPAQPATLLPALARTAVGSSPRNRGLAQALLASHPAVLDLATATLADPKAAVRRAGAQWLASLADPRAAASLRRAYGTEKDWQARAGILQALQAGGDDVSDLLSRYVLEEEAARAARRLPAALGWLDPRVLPCVRWADGEPLDPAVVRWLVVLAHRLGSPDGRGMVQACLSLLDPGDAAHLGGTVAEAWAAHSRETDKGASLPTKGLLALTVVMEGEPLGRLARSCLRASATRRAESEAVLTALRASGAPEAVQVLADTSRRHRLPRVRDAAAALLEDLAREHGWGAEELADRTIPTAGLSPDGLLHLDYGTREFLGRVGTDLTVVLTDSDGRPLKSLPRARKDEDGERVAEARSTLAAARKEARAVLEAQAGRLYAAMCAGRSWPYPLWRALLATHPLVSRLVTRLVWVAQDAGGRRTFRPAEDGQLLGADDEVVRLGQEARVSLAHATLLSRDEVAAWWAHLEDYEVTPLFDQLAARAPSTEPGQVSLEVLKGRQVPVSGLQQVMRSRGYQRGSFHLSRAGEYHKEVPAAGMRAVIGFEGRPQAGETVVLGGLGVVSGRQHRPVPVDQVPAVLLAECYADYMACAVLV